MRFGIMKNFIPLEQRQLMRVLRRETANKRLFHRPECGRKTPDSRRPIHWEAGHGRPYNCVSGKQVQ